MVLVEIDPMMVLSSGISATARMLPVLSNASMTMRNMPTQLSCLLLCRSHLISEQK
jgi:hypothetical protein